MTYTRSDRASDTLYISRVSIERLGGVTLPVEVLICFDNGDELLESWDGKESYKDFEYTGNSKVIWAKIDPYDKIDIDIDRINNSWSSVQKFTATRRMANKFVFLMQMMISIFTV
ncbi:MAG: hypothetical protein U5L72_09215 [Bacteroidales bacterium]|nr:hypothetical protein [Bacteroidales bacterium]